MNSRNELVIFDSPQVEQECTNKVVILFSGYPENSSKFFFSILELIDNDSLNIKKEYLKFVYDLGYLKINKRNLIDRLNFNDKFSFWHMGLISEKCNYEKSQYINTIIKLIALEKYLKNQNFSQITYFGSSKKLSYSLQILSEQFGAKFTFKKQIRKTRAQKPSKNFFYRLPIFLQGLVWISRYFIHRWPLRGSGLPVNQDSDALFFVTYFDNLKFNKGNYIKYGSNYWGSLPRMLENEKLKSVWLHIYAEDQIVKSPKVAKKILRNLNNDEFKKHIFLDSFLSLNIFFKTIKVWLYFRQNSKFSKIIEKKLGFNYIFLDSDIKESLYGLNLLNNILFFLLFEEYFRKIKNQSKCYYLFEGQGWEYALVSLWKNHNKERITGVAHTAIKFWDLRSFSDQRFFNNNKLNIFPDYIAVNNIFAKKLLLESGMPSRRIKILEALRYEYLSEFNYRAIHKSKNNKLLVLTDYVLSKTESQLETLVELIKLVDIDIEIIIKPHPNCQIPDKFKSILKYKITSKPIDTILNEFSVVYASNATSASIDAFCTGKSVIVMLDNEGLNLSPLMGLKDVFFVGNSMQLSKVINNLFNKPIKSSRLDRNFFILDKKLSKWKEELI